LNLNNRQLHEKLYSLVEAQKLNEEELMLILVSLDDESMDEDRIRLKKKLESLTKNRELEPHEFEFIEKKLSSSLIPWFSIISVLFGSFGLILLDSSTSAIMSLFKLSEMMALAGVIFGVLALSRREMLKPISVIGLLLSLLVLLVDNTILFGL